MKSVADFFVVHWRDLLGPAAVTLATLAVGWVAEKLLFRWLRRWAARTTTNLDDIIFAALKRPFMLWVLILGIHLGLQSSNLPLRAMSIAAKGLLILWVLSLTIVASSLAASLVRHYGASLRDDTPVTTLSQNLVRLVVGSMGLLIILNAFGVSITPILTALGVGGLAVALALQETLSNLFAGFYVSVAGHVRVGDYIRLNGGEEGHVTDISWRATTLKSLGSNLIVVPNSKLAQAIVTNFSLPARSMSVSVAVNVSCDSDADRVERVLVDVATSAVGQVPGLLAEPAPVARLSPGFGESGLGFTLFCQVGEFTDQFYVQHVLRKRILARFGEEGIRISFPTRTLFVRQEGPSA